MTDPRKTSFTDFFIHRPIFAWVINIIVVLLGLTAFFQLATRQYPVTESTRITVRTTMDASAKIMEQQVTKPLEDALSSLQGLDAITSKTEKNESTISLEFANRAIDAAASDAREILFGRARETIPEEAKIEITKSSTTAPTMMELALTGDNVSLVDLYYAAENVLKSAVESIPGVSMVEILGGSEYQMNIVLDPTKMASYTITAHDISTALRNQNFQKSAGQIKETERQFSLTTQAKLRTPNDFKNIIVSKNGNRLVRISDIASVNIEPKEEQVVNLYNGKPAVVLSMRQQANANPIAISKEVTSRLSNLEKNLPKGSKVHIALDKSVFIQDTINQVYKTLFEAVVLVLCVVFIFLRSFRASLIPLITIPISLIGAFFLMYLMGFTINVLSLLALVLAIGLVVDDAIIVLENIYRYMEKGMSSFQAAILGTREIQFSVIAMTITLAAVYAPIAITPGIIGKVFKEFALTLAGAVIISGFTALTLSPAMCARLLKNEQPLHGASHVAPSGFWGKSSSFIESMLTACENLYTRGLKKSLEKKWIVLLAAAAFSVVSGVGGWLYLKKEMSPPTDEGIVKGRFYSAPSMNLNYIKRRANQISDILKKQPDLQNYLVTMQNTDISLTQSMLQPWSIRKQSCQDIVKSINEQSESVLGLSNRAYCATSSVVSSGESQFPLSFDVLSHKSAEELTKMGRQIRRMLSKYPGVEMVDMSENFQQDEYEIKMNRDRVAQLGIDPEDISTTLSILVRGSNIGTFEKEGRICPVHVWILSSARSSIEGLSGILIRGRDNNNNPIMVPLGELITVSMKKGDTTIEHTAKNRSYSVQAKLNPSYSLADTYLNFKKDLEETLPSDYSIQPTGELARYFKEQGGIYLIFGLALVFIFLVMAAQFESIRDPMIILISVPLALGGAILSLFFLSAGSINVYSQIGLITLIGLITKHGILLVDFANQEKAKGLTSLMAIVESCRLRLRPILMTTFAMVLGAIPLAISVGSGAEARNQIGVVIVGGMTIGTLFTLFVVPALYVTFSRSTKKALEE